MADFNFNTSTELLSKASAEHLYEALLEQLKKDFQLANVDFTTSAAITLEVLVIVLQERLYLLLLEEFDAFLNLLYIVDVPENSFEVSKAVDAFEASQQAAFLILKRELKKVWYKQKYS